jgi:hypothetical protein
MQSDGSKRMGFERDYLGRQEPQVEQPLPLVGRKVEVHLLADRYGTSSYSLGPESRKATLLTGRLSVFFPYWPEVWQLKTA